MVCIVITLITGFTFGQRPSPRPTPSPKVQQNPTVTESKQERLKQEVNKPTYGKYEPVELVDYPIGEASEYKYQGIISQLRTKGSVGKPHMSLDKKVQGLLQNYVHCNEVEVNVDGTANELVLVSNIADTYIWPGARYNSLGFLAGKFQEVPANFGSGYVTLTSSLGDKTVKMEQSAILNAKAQILQQKTGGTTASLKAETHVVNSKEDFMLQTSGSFTGVNYGVYGGDVAFNFSKSNIRSRLFIEIVQPLFTMGIQSPKSPYDFFSNLPGSLKIPDHWLYIRSVTYGRRVMIALESQNEISEFKSDIEAYFVGLAYNGSGSVSTKTKNALQNTTVKILVQGGDPGDQAMIPLFTLGSWKDLEQQVGELKSALAKYLKNVKLQQAVPLAFSMCKIRDNSLLDIRTTGKFNYKSCYFLPKKYEVKVAEILTKIATDGNGNEQIFCYSTATAYDSQGNRYWGKNGQICDIPDNFPCGVSLNVGSEDHPVACYTGQPVDPKVQADLVMPLNVVKDPNAYILLFMRMVEEDDFTDDDFGKYNVKIYMRDLHSGTNEIQLQFGEGGSIVDVRIELKPLYQ